VFGIRRIANDSFPSQQHQRSLVSPSFPEEVVGFNILEISSTKKGYLVSLVF